MDSAWLFKWFEFDTSRSESPVNIISSPSTTNSSTNDNTIELNEPGSESEDNEGATGINSINEPPVQIQDQTKATTINTTSTSLDLVMERAMIEDKPNAGHHNHNSDSRYSGGTITTAEVLSPLPARPTAPPPPTSLSEFFKYIDQKYYAHISNEELERERPFDKCDGKPAAWPIPSLKPGGGIAPAGDVPKFGLRSKIRSISTPANGNGGSSVIDYK